MAELLLLGSREQIRRGMRYLEELSAAPEDDAP
jgi:hypothetical protein